MDLISVIVPVYNMEKFINKGLMSVLNQTYTNLQIIVIDDGSIDRSSQLCDEIASMDDRVVIVHKKNDGIGNARNTGIDLSCGKYLYFLDPDDYIEENTIMTLYNSMTAYGADTVIAGYKNVTECGDLISVCKYDTQIYENDKVQTECLARILGSDVIVKDSIKPMVWNSLYSNEIVKKYNVQFSDERILIAEDLYFNINYMKYANKVYISNNIGYNYRKNTKSFTAIKYKKSLLEKCIDMHKYEDKQLEQIGIYERCKYRLSRQFFIRLKICLSQENTSISHKKFVESIQSMLMILNNEYVRKQLLEYPINNTGYKQKIFLYLCKYKIVLPLYFLLKYM